MTSMEAKAIGWWCETHDLTPQLSAWPLYRFKDKQGNETAINIISLVADYKAERKRNAGKKDKRLA